jgi:hypothetical protein
MTVPLPDADEFRKFHAKMPLSGKPVNAILAQPDDLVRYLVAVIRSEPCAAPTRSAREWEVFMGAIRVHWIQSLVAFNLHSWPEECQPPRECMEDLNRTFLSGTARNMLAGGQIKGVCDALRTAGIPALIIKGPALAHSVYPDPSIRQSADIDLLVQPQHMPATEEVLEKLGYTCPLKYFHNSPDKNYEENFYPRNKGLTIELHWAADYGFNIFPPGWLDEAFDRRIPVRSGDLSFETLSYTDHLLYLAFHNVFQHQSVRLDWVYDISLILGKFRTQEEWEELGRRSAELNVRVPLELLITAARLWTGCRLPAGVKDFSGWPTPSDRELQLAPLSESFATSLYPKVCLYLQGKVGIGQKLRFLFHIIVPPVPMLKDYRRSDSALDIPAAYVRRWIGIVRMI